VSPLEACVVLGISPTDDWVSVRRAYRLLIRRAHPDLGRKDAEGSLIDASAITGAFAIVRAAYESGELPSTPGSTTAMLVRTDVAVLRIPDGADPFIHLLDVAHRLGEVTYQDADSGLFQLLVLDPGTARYQLAGEVEVVDDEIHVAFSLEPIGPGPVPPIAAVVARFGRLSRTD
jgi:hypothetical protein